MNNMSITIPLEYNALVRASDMLHGLAQDCKRDDGTDLKAVAPTTPVEPVQATPVEPVQATPVETVQATPVQATPTPPVQPDPSEPDANGIRWDGRIHTKSKTRLVRGDTWKLIRNIDPALVEQVKAEQDQMTEEQVPLAFEIGSDDQAAPIASQTFAPVAAVVEPVVAVTFPSLMQKITQRRVERPEFGDIINAVLAEFNVPSLPALVPMVEIIPQIDARLDQLWQG